MQDIGVDTIAAIATPPGEGAIGIVRISGRDAIGIADRIFRGSRALRGASTHTVHHGILVDPSGDQVDEVLATIFLSPHSYTGEDVVEIGCHGGQLVTTAVLHTVISAGARAAAPGEFTRRAFLNGRLDLSQAEAVADLISSRSERARRVSLEQLEGKLAGKVKEMKSEMLDLCSLLELDLDFAEENLIVISRPEIERRLSVVEGRLQSMAATFQTGKLLRDGVSVVLAGRPNAGKSSLFNALLKEDRAIVTHVPGTTRDSLEEAIAIHGVLFRLTDTAGLRDTDDPVEKQGVLRSRAALHRADIIVVVRDCTQPSPDDGDIPAEFLPSSVQHFLSVWNKVDLCPSFSSDERRREGDLILSAKTGEGLETFRQALYNLMIAGGQGEAESVQVTNIRHMEAIKGARACLSTARRSLQSGLSNEFVAFDVRGAALALAAITGEVTSEEVLESIFSRFCIGK